MYVTLVVNSCLLLIACHFGFCDETSKLMSPIGRQLGQEFLMAPNLKLNHGAYLNQKYPPLGSPLDHKFQNQEPNFPQLKHGTNLNKKYPPFGRQLRQEFPMDPDFTQINHGAYGPLSKAVSTFSDALRHRVERHPDRWYKVDVYGELLKVRREIAEYVNADMEDVVMVTNGAASQNAVYRSIHFNPGDRILHLNTIYETILPIIQYVVDSSNGTVSTVVFNATYPVTNAEFLKQFEAFLDSVQNPTRPIRVAHLDHITAFPPVIVPIEKLIPMLHKRNISVVVDGAHAIGAIPVNIRALDPDYYIGNCHKWLYAGRSSAMLYVKKKYHDDVHPMLISKYYRRPSDFANEFFYVGSYDYTPYMTIPVALKFRRDVGGEEAIKKYIHDLAMEGGRRMARILGTRIVAEEEAQVGGMTGVQLPITNPLNPKLTAEWWVQKQISEYPSTYAPVIMHNGQWYARASAQIYNDIGDFENLAVHFQRICEDINNNKL